MTPAFKEDIERLNLEVKTLNSQMSTVRDALKNIPPPVAKHEDKRDDDEEIIESIKEKLDPKNPAAVDKDALAN